MNFKRTIPYFLSTAVTLLGTGCTSGFSDKSTTIPTKRVNIFYTQNWQPDSFIPLVLQYAMENQQTPDTIAINAVASKYDVVYTHANGGQVKRTGGTRAWRNNNPGCLRYSEFTVAQGAIGHAGGFAVFPDEATGMQAICALLQSDAYKNLTIYQAIFKYAPPHENDTDNYNVSMQKITGMPTTTQLSGLNDNQIMNVARAIRKIEGWAPGHEIIMQSPTPRPTPTHDTVNFYTALKNNMLSKASFEHMI